MMTMSCWGWRGGRCSTFGTCSEKDAASIRWATWANLLQNGKLVHVIQRGRRARPHGSQPSGLEDACLPRSRQHGFHAAAFISIATSSQRSPLLAVQLQVAEPGDGTRVELDAPVIAL